MLNIKSDSNVLFGCAIHPRWFNNDMNVDKYVNQIHVEIPDDSQYLSTICNNFNAIVIEHHMKWGPILKNDARRLYDFAQCDSIVDWAITHNIIVKGHVLIWHVTSPQWLNDLEPSDLKEELRNHIFVMMKHFQGRIKYWDVVNEALAPNGELADNIFLKKLGPSYIDDCFRWAHEADPEAILIYNDNKVESCQPVHTENEGVCPAITDRSELETENGAYYEKSDAFYNLVKGMIDRGVPIHHVGLQAHFNATATGKGRVPTPTEFGCQIQRLISLGLYVNISEFDIRVSKLRQHFENEADEWNWRLRVQEQITRKLLRVCYKVGKEHFLGVWWWGVHDKSSWCHKFYYPGDRPLLFDDNFQRKCAYNGVISAFADEDMNDEWGIVDGLSWLPVEETVISEGISDNNHRAIVEIATAKPDWEL